MSKVEIKVSPETPFNTTIMIDGTEITGVRRFELIQDMENNYPLLRLDLSAVDLTINSPLASLSQYGAGEIEEIKFKNGLKLEMEK